MDTLCEFILQSCLLLLQSVMHSLTVFCLRFSRYASFLACVDQLVCVTPELIFLPDLAKIWCSMIFGHLKAVGFHVPIERIAASYLRVHSAPGTFGG